MNTFALDKNYSQFNFEEISVDELEIISGGTGAANVNDGLIGQTAGAFAGIRYGAAIAQGVRTGAQMGMFFGVGGAIGGAVVGAAIGAMIVYG